MEGEHEAMNKSFIDDNGNPCEDESQAQELKGETEMYQTVVLDEAASTTPLPPRYFINAADLSEEEFNPERIQGESNAGEKAEAVVAEVKKPRSRVPISKSYPDIVQTTFSKKKAELEQKLLLHESRPMAKENSDLESLVADSLENLVISAPAEKEKDEGKGSSPTSEKIPERDSNVKSKGIGIMSASALMTESQMSGLFAEKPPEAWIIDLNSLSMESPQFSPSRNPTRGKSGGHVGGGGGGGGGSGASSLAFFVNIDDRRGDGRGVEENNATSMSSSLGEKKMFSMFVDMKERESGRVGVGRKSHIPNLKKCSGPAINKPVHNLMETSSMSMSSNSMSKPKKPSTSASPTFQHKAAAEAARKAARLEWEMQKEKYLDSLHSLEPSALCMMDHSSGVMGESTLCSSNRSSLHVANVLDSSFSSSVISSMDVSQPGDMELCQGGPCFKLGKDLLRMFQDGINTDVIISVNGKFIRAHKCILSSRSQYFAAILSGNWVEKAGNTVNLDGFSYSVVQFALYHIYSGTNELPDSIDLLELATLTDLLGLEGLRENISQTFKNKYCHNFHRPCTGCITGVLECFPIAANYGMEELHRKMIKWTCKHFVRIWCTKGFASLGDEQINRCLKYSMNHLSIDNILDHTLGCDQLLTTMPTLRWTEPIFNMVTKLAEKCVEFVGENLCDVLQSQKFLQFGKGQAWNISRIETTFTESLSLLKPDMACLSHTALTRLIELGTETMDEVEWSTSFVEFLTFLKDEVERYLLANASKAVLSKCWEELSSSTRKKICSSSFVGYDKFGNKVVKNKNTSASAGSTSGGGTSGNKLQRERSSGKMPNVSSQQSQQTQRPISSGNKPTREKSMQSQSPEEKFQTPTLTSNRQQASASASRVRTLSNVGRSATMSSTRSDADSSTSSSRDHSSRTVRKAQVQKTLTVDRPSISRRASTSTATASPTHSSSRTPSKPSTPVVPSKSSPLMGGGSKRHSSSAKLRLQSTQPEPEPSKRFLTNSAKAAAVSKPVIKPRKVTESGSQSPTHTYAFTFRENGLRSSSRKNREGKPASEVKSKVDSRPPTSRKNVPEKSRAQSAAASGKRPSSSSSGLRTNTSSSTTTRKHLNSGPASIPLDYEPDSLMSKSSIEVEQGNGEAKMRTLAEIGRSSTFSKDEPTVLGKMESSVYSQNEYDDDYSE